MGCPEKQIHNIAPVFDADSKILILGSFPSVRSRECGFFYGHPRNRFWKLIAALTDWKSVPESVSEKKRMLIENNIAVWDVIASCDIYASSDSSIKNAVPNDISLILGAAEISLIACNGGKAYDLYNKYLYPLYCRKAVKLPSSSPANASCSLDFLIFQWKNALGF